MGGSNSGRWGSRKPFAEHLVRFDLATIGKGCELSTASTISAGYTRRNGQKVSPRLCLTSTRTQFGGRRLWFCCPSCGARARVLFGSWRIACRKCHGLRYMSQAETETSRINRAMFKIVKRLDPEAEAADWPAKPPNMHWETYRRLEERYGRLDERWAVNVMGRFLRVT